MFLAVLVVFLEFLLVFYWCLVDLGLVCLVCVVWGVFGLCFHLNWYLFGDGNQPCSNSFFSEDLLKKPKRSKT